MDSRSIGLNLGLSEDNSEDSEDKEVSDWGMLFALLKNRGFTHQEILELSYPQFNAYMNNINNELCYNIVIPYMGGGKEDNGSEIESKDELLSVVAELNRDFSL